MKIIVGLGNPEKEYDGTRHNVGREVVRALAEHWGLHWKIEKKLCAEIAELKEGSPRLPAGRDLGSNDKILLALPTTFMNDSGKSVQALVTSYAASGRHPANGGGKLLATSLLIVHDDLDLPLGTLRFSQGSGAAGQKGVQSIIDTLGTKDFARLRIGVAGAHRERTDAADYVLKKFSKDEQEVVMHIKQQALKALKDFINEPLTKVMSIYNAPGVSASQPD